MRAIYSPDQLLHDAAGEFNRGAMVQPFERPERVEMVLAAVDASRLFDVQAPDEFPEERITRIHSAAMVDFLKGAYDEWLALERAGDALPLTWPIRGFRSDRVPESLDGRLSYYCFDISTSINQGTWAAARSAANVALTGASLIARGAERGVFGVCRPPGHHAATDYFGGYCFLNNAAIAAQYLRDNGAARVAILDVDYHHGNGTQEIFYPRADVLFASIHANPATDFPYFLGYADELGVGAGKGCNLNLPLAQGADWPLWSAALDTACEQIAHYAPDALVVSLGLDTYRNDPLSHFKLDTTHYPLMGQRIAALSVPTLFVLEGGYAISDLGVNAVNVMRGFEGG